MAATLEYIGLNTVTPPTTTSGNTATLTFQAASSDCRARWLFVDGYDNSGDITLTPGLLGFIHVSEIRINAGPNLVTGLIPVGCFASHASATNGFPSAEMNISLNTGDVVTVVINDSNPVAAQTLNWMAQLKVDSASSTADTNTAVSVIGNQTYWLGSSTALTPIAAGANGTWTSHAAPFELYLDYQYLFYTDSPSAQLPATKSGLLLTGLVVSTAPGVDYVDGFASADPQVGLNPASSLDTGQQVRILIPAGATVQHTYENISASSTTITLGWSVLSNN